ncbi:glycosyltransferase [Clostridium sp. MCC353]|uniref:glycosyltransferase family 2 protein n=1 Tax=Clostridium sp. MCC353 TaxID=2592646 RepID=UPI001C013484|nr:glycosyltransferase [Clostridium sp. MCC353]MBT9777206.1 glycosyltransferase [Clostridium sp. MCC353]
MMVDISVIMAIHNEEKGLILRAVQSILNQTYQNFELILCNDASNEEISLFLEEIVDLDSRISLIVNKVNEYAARTRNKGIAAAQGKYIAIMDADDYCYPHRLETEFIFLEANPGYDFVCSDAELFDGSNVLPSQYRLKAEPQKEDFLWSMPFVHATVMIKRECLLKANGYSAARVCRRAEDYDLFMRLYALGYRGYNLQDVLYQYYVNVEMMRKKRRYQYRIDEAIVRLGNFRKLGLMPKGIPYVIKPLLVGLIPHRLIWKLKEKR